MTRAFDVGACGVTLIGRTNSVLRLTTVMSWRPVGRWGRRRVPSRMLSNQDFSGHPRRLVRGIRWDPPVTIEGTVDGARLSRGLHRFLTAASLRR